MNTNIKNHLTLSDTSIMDYGAAFEQLGYRVVYTLDNSSSSGDWTFAVQSFETGMFHIASQQGSWNLSEIYYAVDTCGFYALDELLEDFEVYMESERFKYTSDCLY